jgi:hypothetical protein
MVIANSSWANYPDAFLPGVHASQCRCMLTESNADKKPEFCEDEQFFDGADLSRQCKPCRMQPVSSDIQHRMCDHAGA